MPRLLTPDEFDATLTDLLTGPVLPGLFDPSAQTGLDRILATTAAIQVSSVDLPPEWYLP
jgi:hypothetical protein